VNKKKMSAVSFSSENKNLRGLQEVNFFLNCFNCHHCIPENKFSEKKRMNFPVVLSLKIIFLVTLIATSLWKLCVL